MTTVTILAPAYNEEEVLPGFLQAVLPRLSKNWDLLVVDDGSTDGTAGILAALEDPRLRVVSHPSNRGLGAALATGFSEARAEIIVTIDADLSHPLDLVEVLVERAAVADAVFASRYVPGGGMPGVPLLRVLISRVANAVLRVLFRSPVRDLTTGYRAYRKSVVEALSVRGTGFEAQLEITIRLLHLGARIEEIPLLLEARAAGESKMRYLRLIRRYGLMMLRMLALRWFGIGAR